MSTRMDNVFLAACEKEITRLDAEVIKIQRQLISAKQKTALRCLHIYATCKPDVAVKRIDKEFGVSAGVQEKLFNNEE